MDMNNQRNTNTVAVLQIHTTNRQKFKKGNIRFESNI